VGVVEDRIAAVLHLGFAGLAQQHGAVAVVPTDDLRIPRALLQCGHAIGLDDVLSGNASPDLPSQVLQLPPEQGDLESMVSK
jgi:hypothetical protein